MSSQSFWPPPPVDVIARTDTTSAKHQHPKDHNDIQAAINAILLVLGSQPFGASDSLTAELARLQTQLTSVSTTPGPPGPAGPQRFYGEGPPGVLIGARPADEYVDTLTGDLYILQ